MILENGIESRKSGFSRYMLAALLSSGSMYIGHAPAAAQAADTGAARAQSGELPQRVDTGELADIIVTATKRAVSIQSVPMSITAIPTRELEQAHVRGFRDFARLVPNISYSSGAEAFGRRLALRGIYGTNTVGFYIDDLPIPADLNPRVMDLDRIEVLRGPQGTLFGARSMGGTIRQITNRPDTKAFSGQASLDLSAIQNGTPGGQLSWVLNIPLVDDVAAIRATGYVGRDGAFITREWPDANDPAILHRKKVGANKFYGGSISGLVNVTDRLTVRATILGQQSQLDGWQLSDFTPSTMIQRRPFNIPEFAKQRWIYGGLSIDYTTSFGTFTSATAYFDLKGSSAEDSSETLPIFFGVPAFDGPPSRIWRPNHEFTEEFRFTSNFAGPLQFVGGIYYNRSRDGFTQFIDAPGLDERAGGIFGTDLILDEVSIDRSTEVAPFGELTLHLSNALSATVGYRYSWISRRSFDSQTGLAGTGETDNLTGKDRAASPKFVIKYEPSPDLNIYALASKGFRPGSNQTPPPIGFCEADYAAAGLTPAELRDIKPDSLWNYEAGVKSGLFGGRVRLNADAFWIKWKGIQQSARFDCGFNFQVNAGEARSRGFELEFAATPVPHLNLSGGVGYTDAVITKSASFLFTKVGDPVQNVAPWTVYLSGAYDYNIAQGLDGYFRVDGNYVGRSFSATNDTENPRRRAPYTMINVRTGVTKDFWEIAAYIDNIGNVHANLGDNNSGAAELPGRPRWLVSPPRTFGVQVTARW